VFIFVIIAIFVLQILLVTFGGTAFGVYNNYGLTIQHWMMSIGIGSISILVNLILKLLPIAKQDHSDGETSKP
jgi:Ni/Fe-hydrogenase subunit HybB-like protein